MKKIVVRFLSVSLILLLAISAFAINVSAKNTNEYSNKVHSSTIGISPITTYTMTETKFYLFGDIHGAQYSILDYLNNYDELNLDEYNFKNGILEVSFDEDSYVAIKDSNNNHFMIDSSLSYDSTSAILYKTTEANINDITKMIYIPAQTNVNFTLSENSDGTLILSYEFTPYNEFNESRTRLVMLMADYSWDFDYTPEYWYSFYTKESYDNYLAVKKKAEKLLADENATDEQLENVGKEFKTARKNLVSVAKSDIYKQLAYLYATRYEYNQGTPEYWYSIYTKESYDTYLGVMERAEKLLADENATDEELEAMINEIKTAENNLVRVDKVDTPKTTEPTATDQYLIGDVDGDGIVTVKDVTYIQLHLANLESLTDKGKIAADYDKDGSLTVKDATYIQLYLANLL